VDIIIASKATLFVSAVGVPPKEVIEKLHKAGIVVMKCVLGLPTSAENGSLTFCCSMVGHPKVCDP
jgi:NAD(P)H-dependent flavin oxidoreductase YrpB (nitropropane dioxygenase family)